jgi:hypothetical protein
MTDKPVKLDQHRGMAAQKATELRRLLAEVAVNERTLRAAQDALEAQLLAAPASPAPVMVLLTSVKVTVALRQRADCPGCPTGSLCRPRQGEAVRCAEYGRTSRRTHADGAAIFDRTEQRQHRAVVDQDERAFGDGGAADQIKRSTDRIDSCLHRHPLAAGFIVSSRSVSSGRA